MTHKRRYASLSRTPFLVLTTCAFLISIGLSRTGKAVDPPTAQPPERSGAMPAASPTPELGQVFGALSEAAGLAKLIKELDKNGPRVNSLDTGEISLEAFISRNIVIRYYLEKGATAEVVVKFTEKGLTGFKGQLQTGTGEVVQEVISIPSLASGKAQPGKITIRAQIKPANGKKRLADFNLHSLQIGLTDLTATAGQSVVPRLSYLSLAGWFPASATPQAKIGELTVSPLSVKAGTGEKVVYGFRPRSTFQKWAADFRAISTQTKDGRQIFTTRAVRIDTFDEALIQNAEVRRHWDGLDKSGKPSLGSHRLTIRAWRTLEKGGAALLQIADEIIQVK